MLRTKKEVDRHVRELLTKVKNENDRKSRGYNISRLYFSISEYESARRYLSEFISLQPKSPDGHKLMGQIYEKLGQKDKAVASFKTSYNISNTQKELIPKICELYADMDVDTTIRAHWADEGEKLFPHHNSVVKLKQSLMLANPSQSKEELESFYLREIKANPLSLSLHIKLSKLFLEWAKEDAGKYEEAFNYVIKVEERRPFPHSLEWYQTVVEVLKAYENWKKPNDDSKFEELFLSILDRYIFESLASSCGPALSALCSPKESAQRLQEFDVRLVKALKIFGKESLCGRHMIAEFYFGVALLISLLGKTESILHKDIYLGCLLLHAGYLPGKEARPPFSGSEYSESIKTQWHSLGHYRVSQAGHMLNQLAHAYRGQKHYLSKIQEICLNEQARKHIHRLVFESSSEQCKNSLLLTDDSFMQGELTFVDQKTQLLCDQSVTLTYSHDLRELVWLYNQYSSLTVTSVSGKFFNFHFFRSLPFASSMNTFAPETLCHLDLVAFIVATAYCQKANTDVHEDAIGTSCPSILAVYLHTPEQGEWWNAAASLCSNMGGKRLNRLRSILQNGLESVRHLGHHVLPLHLTIHLAKYFTACISEARDEGNSTNEIESLEERAEHYWMKVIGHCRRSAKGTFGPTPKSRLFEVRRCELNESELQETSEEGELFIADRLVAKGRREEAIQILSRLKSPRAAFNRAMLYKKEAQSLLGNRTWHSLNLNARNDYTSLLTQSRDALYLTLDRLKMPGEEPSDPLSLELSEELMRIEHSLATVTVEDYSDDHSDADGLGDIGSTPRGGFHPSMGLMNGNASVSSQWSTQTYNISTNLFSTPTSTNRTQRQEARPSPERLDAQVRHLTELQQNTIRNIEEHNAALRAQNEALLHTCQTMSAEFKENVAFYRSYIEQKNSDADHINPILDQLKQLQGAIKGLQLEVQTLSSEVMELRNLRTPQNKPEPLQLVTASSSAPDNQVPIEIASPAMQGVYNNYMGFYGQQPVVSPLVPPPAIFNPCQPPFMPPSTLQDQAYMSTTTNTMNSETSGSPMLPTSLYQPSALNLKAVQSKAPEEELSTTGPPHSYQISLPTTSSIAFSSVAQTLSVTTSETTFNTEGLLSNVPAPLYSAIATNQSSDKIATRNLLASTLSSTSVAHSTRGLGTSTTPTFGQWPSSGANFPPGPPPVVQVLPSPVAKPSPAKSASESDHYVDDGHDPCPDFKPIIPLPAQVEVYTGEEEEKVLFEGRAKLFRFVEKEWKERGLGPLKILHNESQNTVRVLMRRDQTHKICCNHFITSALELTTMPDNDKVWVWAAQDYADEKLTVEKFCCKFKTAEVAQDFQKAFYKGRMIAEAATDKAKKEASLAKSPEVKSLSEIFKPAPGSWTCSTCLISNKKELLSCTACQNLKPGETKVQANGSSSAVSTSSKSKVTFKFGIQSPNQNASSTTLTFLGDKTNVTPAFSFGIPTSKPTITFGVPTSTSSSSTNGASSFGSNTQLTFGPSSSVTISPIKPGSTPSISIFKTTPASVITPSTTSADAVSSVSNTVITLTPTKSGGGKFSLEGFTFSSEPTLVPPKTKDETQQAKSLDKPELKKESIFSKFSFTSSKQPADDAHKEMFVINLPASTATSTSTTILASKVSTSSGGLFEAANISNTLSFGALAASESAEKSIFTTKDAKAFQPKPLFDIKESSGSPLGKPSIVQGSNISKEDAEDYEPQVEFKPVVPMPDLVDIKTGEEEEEKLLCERAKLYRYDVKGKEWKERGVGEVKLLKNKGSNKVRLLMRRDQTHKICANHFLTIDMKLSAMPNSEKAWVWAAGDYADEEVKAEKFAIRFKTQELANNFKTIFEEAQKSLAVVPTKEGDNISVSPQLTSATLEEINQNKPLSELFKASTGSWECSVCLVLNEPNVSSCVACSNAKDVGPPDSGASKGALPLFSGSTTFPFISSPSETFTFGVPPSSASASLSSSSSSNVSNTTGTSSSTFSFGFHTRSSTTTVDSSSITTTSAVTPSTQPFNLVWNDATTTTTSAGESKPTVTIPVKTSTAAEFTFGSPGKYEFSFSGVRSPRSRDTSTCESEGVAAQDDDDDEEEDLYFEPIVPLPKKVEVVTGEEDEVVVYCHRAKLYRMKEGEFKERGLGDIKILEHKQTGKIRLLMRREQVHKLCLNHYLTKELEFRSKDEKAFCWVTTDFSEPEPSKETFAIRFKNPEIAKSFATALKDAQAKLGKSSASERAAVKPDTTNSAITTTTTASSDLPSAFVADTENSTNFGVFGTAAVTSTPKSQFSFGDRFLPRSQSKDSFISDIESNELEIVYEKKATPEQVERARKLLLPDNFFLYEDAEPCSGCLGCTEDDLVFRKATTNDEAMADSKDALNFVKTTRFSGSSSPSLEFKSSAPPSITTPTFSFGNQSMTSSSSTGNLFGGSSISSQSGSIFGGVAILPQQTGFIFGNKSPTATTTATPSIFGGLSTTTATSSIFGGLTTATTTTATTTSIFGGLITTTATATPSLFSSQSSWGSGNICGGTKVSSSTTTTTTDTTATATPSLFGDQLGSDPVFDDRQSNSSPNIFGAFKASTPASASQPSLNEEETGSGAFGSQAIAVLSFSDMAKQTSQSTFGKTTSTNPSAWVSKPVFAAKSPESPKSSDKNVSLVDEEYDPHYEPVIPMPELIKVTTGEEGWEQIFSYRAKVYRYDLPTKQWKERGIGDFKIQYEPALKKYRFLQRREQVHKLSCNHYLTPTLELEPMDSSEVAWCWLANDYSENPEGEIMKLAVKFKTKEIATEFKVVFDSCQSKIAALDLSPVRSKSNSLCSVFPAASAGESNPDFAVATAAADVDSSVEALPQLLQDCCTAAAEDDDEYEDVSGSDETEDDVEETEEEDDEDEDEDEDEQITIFSEQCELYLKDDKRWQPLGSADLRIYYDEDAYGARIIGTSKEGKRLVDNLIAIQTTYTVDHQNVSWTSLDELEQPSRKVQVKATFKSQSAVENFASALNEGKEYAYSSGIEETLHNEVPKDLLYYGQASED